jgi:hypothetical protein
VVANQPVDIAATQDHCRGVLSAPELGVAGEVDIAEVVTLAEAASPTISIS